MWQWTPNFIPNKLVVFGCGGTGSRLVPLIAQFIKTCAWVVEPEVILVDFDIVEEKNLLRQNFIASDVGKNKASVLANRYSKAFGMSITAISSKVEEGPVLNEFRELWGKTPMLENTVVFMCVDSPDARRDILGMLLQANQSNTSLLVDTGNENDFGQVTVSSFRSLQLRKTSTVRSMLDKVPMQCPLNLGLEALPLNLEYYESMKAITTLSCADLDQTMAINCQMAVTAFSVLQNVLYCKPIPFHRINVSLQHGSIPEYITPKFLADMADYFNPEGKLDPLLGEMGYGANRFNDAQLGKLQKEVIKYEDFMYDLANPKPVKKKAVKKVVEEVAEMIQAAEPADIAF